MSGSYVVRFVGVLVVLMLKLDVEAFVTGVEVFVTFAVEFEKTLSACPVAPLASIITPSNPIVLDRLKALDNPVLVLFPASMVMSYRPR